MQVCVIINSSAGTVAQAESSLTPAVVENAFRAAGVHPEIHYVPAGDISATVRSAVGKRPDAIVVGGGDGTLSSAAGILVGTELPLGILPFGTLNHFSKDLLIPPDLIEAVAVVAARNVRSVDIAEVNGRVFLNNCSIGAYPEAVRRRDEIRQRQGHGKWWAMTLASIKVLRNLRRLPVEMTVGQQTAARRTPVVLVSNNHYAGHIFSRNLRDRLDTGELWVYTTRTHRVFPLLRLAFLAAIGRLNEARDFESWPAKELLLATSGHALKAGIDGEVIEIQLPLRFRILPSALKVLAPPPAK